MCKRIIAGLLLILLTLSGFTALGLAETGGEDVAEAIRLSQDKDHDRFLAENTFRDVNVADWYAPSVGYNLRNELVKGVSADRYDPKAPVTRAMAVTVLWRFDRWTGPAVHTFRDVEADSWYSEAVTWAADFHVAEGYGNGLFGTTDTITREQAVKMMHAYFEAYRSVPLRPVPIDVDVLGEGKDLRSFADSGDVSEWAVSSMSWATQTGFVVGDGTYLNPKKALTRAEFGELMARLHQWTRAIDGKTDTRPILINRYTGPGEYGDGCNMMWVETPMEAEKLLAVDPAGDRAFDRAGQRIAGWYLDPAYTTPVDPSQVVKEPTVFFAKWEPEETVFPLNWDPESIDNAVITDRETGETLEMKDGWGIRLDAFRTGFAELETLIPLEKTHEGQLCYHVEIQSSDSNWNGVTFDFDETHVERTVEGKVYCYDPKIEDYLTTNYSWMSDVLHYQHHSVPLPPAM